MVTTYIAAANTTTNGQALGAAGQDVFVKKLIIGAPVASANIIIYNKAVAYSGDAQNIAFKMTIPATITYQYTNANAITNVIDFTGGTNSPGMVVDGGNVMIDQALQLTVLWEAQESGGGGQG
jgi:hypothetical protein